MLFWVLNEILQLFQFWIKWNQIQYSTLNFLFSNFPIFYFLCVLPWVFSDKACLLYSSTENICVSPSIMCPFESIPSLPVRQTTLWFKLSAVALNSNKDDHPTRSDVILTFVDGCINVQRIISHYLALLQWWASSVWIE